MTEKDWVEGGGGRGGRDEVCESMFVSVYIFFLGLGREAVREEGCATGRPENGQIFFNVAEHD